MAADIKAFIAQVLGKITDPGLKAHAETVFNDATVQAQLKDGVAGQAEIDRQLQELRTKTEAVTTRTQELDDRDAALTKWHGELTGWRRDQEDLVKVGVEAKKAGWKPGQPPPKVEGDPKIPDNVMTVESFNERMASTEQAFLGFTAAANELQRQHFAQFNEILAIEPLLKHGQIKDLGLEGVYRIVHKDRLESAAKATQEAHDKKVADEAVAAYKAANPQLPYLVGNSGPGSGSPLDGLGAQRPTDLVGAASAEYTRLVANRAS